VIFYFTKNEKIPVCWKMSNIWIYTRTIFPRTSLLSTVVEGLLVGHAVDKYFESSSCKTDLQYGLQARKQWACCDSCLIGRISLSQPYLTLYSAIAICLNSSGSATKQGIQQPFKSISHFEILLHSVLDMDEAALRCFCLASNASCLFELSSINFAVTWNKSRFAAARRNKTSAAM